MANNKFKPGWIAQIFYFIGACVLYNAWRLNHNTIQHDDVSYFTAFLIAIPIFIIGGLIFSYDRKRAMKDLDGVASWTLKNALSAVKKGESLPVMLYLRPFELTNKMRFNNPKPATIFTPDYFSEDRVIDIETMIAEQVADSTPLVALGEPGEHIGAGRLLSTEKDWQKAIRDMARAVGRILVLPSDRPGTKWELQWLKKKQHLNKCYFLMPPQPDHDEINMKAYWTETANSLRDIGILLPTYDPKGQIFTLTPAGKFKKRYRINLFSDNGIEKAINKLEAGRTTKINKKSKNIDKISMPVSVEPALPEGDRSTRRKSKTSSKVSNVSGAYTPRPKQQKTRTVSYNYIYGVLLIFIILWNLCGKGGEKYSSEDIKEISEYSERLKNQLNISSDYIESHKSPLTGSFEHSRLVSTPSGASIRVPKEWHVIPQPKINGIEIRPTKGSLMGILSSKKITEDVISPDQFLSELDSNTFVNSMRENLILDLEGILTNLNFSLIKFKTSIVEKIAIIEYEVKVVGSIPSKPSAKIIAIQKGKTLYRGGKIVTAYFCLSKEVFQLHSELVRKMLSSVEFGTL